MLAVIHNIFSIHVILLLACNYSQYFETEQMGSVSAGESSINILQFVTFYNMHVSLLFLST